jgi:hypothetical protein
VFINTKFTNHKTTLNLPQYFQILKHDNIYTCVYVYVCVCVCVCMYVCVCMCVYVCMYTPKGDELTGKWRKLYTEELNDQYCSPNIFRVIKSRRMRLAGYVPRMGE